DRSVGDRHVEVGAHESPEAPRREGAHRLLVVLHRYAISSKPSTTRFEKPHSLSYHASTLTSVPSSTEVESASSTLLAGLPMTSEQTMGSSQYSRMPFMGPSAAAFIAAFTASLVTDFFTRQTRSTSEPSITGARTEIPSSRPLSSGSTSPIALAAPVV